MQNLESIGSDMDLFSSLASIGSSFELASRMVSGVFLFLNGLYLGFGM